jgi:hypothetical protein
MTRQSNWLGTESTSTYSWNSHQDSFFFSLEIFSPANIYRPTGMVFILWSVKGGQSLITEVSPDRFHCIYVFELVHNSSFVYLIKRARHCSLPPLRAAAYAFQSYTKMVSLCRRLLSVNSPVNSPDAQALYATNAILSTGHISMTSAETWLNCTCSIPKC